MTYESRDWSAWYNEMPPGHDPRLHISGTVVLPSSSIALSCQAGDIGVAPDPGGFALEISAEVPAIGDDLMDERVVSWAEDVGPGITHVRIQGVTSAEIPEVITAT